MATRRGFIRVMGGGVILAAAGGIGLARCDRMPAEAIAAWEGPGAGNADLRKRLLSYAILAPNPHNRQSWLIDLPAVEAGTPAKIVLYVDRERLLPETDPYSRQIMIGQGTFVELLHMAAAAAGYRADIALFPQGEPPADRLDGRPVAEIALVEDGGVRPDPLFKQVLDRRTNRERFDTDRPVDRKTIEQLKSAVADPAIRFAAATDRAAVANLRKLVADGFIKELRTPKALGESIELMRIGAGEIAKHRDGISIHGPMMWWLRNLGLVSREAIGDPTSQSFEVGLDMARDQGETAMAFAWLSTDGNSRTEQVRAGRAYVRMHLKATELGLAQHPMSQLLQEYAEMRTLQLSFLKEIGAKESETVQMLARLGYAAAPGPAPRRPLATMTKT